MNPMAARKRTMSIRRLQILAALALVCITAGCATQVTVKGDVPSPLSRPLPVTANLVLDDELTGYTYREEDGRKVTFAIGKAQADMFRTISKSLFASVRETDTPVTAGEGRMLVLHPAVEEIQLATPYQTQLKVFEVWIRYNIRASDGNGNLLADWIMTAYGKTPTRFLGSDEDALNQAAIVALRDAGARLILEFPRIPEIRQWLATPAMQADTAGVEP